MVSWSSVTNEINELLDFDSADKPRTLEHSESPFCWPNLDNENL
jgi:hypothetical protein